MEFAYVKATEGISVSDKLFAQNWGAMKTAGILRGAYDFFHTASSQRTRPISSLKSRATYQRATCRHHWTWKKPAKLTNKWPDIPSAERIDLVLRWLTKVEAATGMKTVIYTRQGWVNDKLPGAEALKDRPLWVADYKSTQTPVIPPQWPTWTFWQFSETRTVLGVNSKMASPQT